MGDDSDNSEDDFTTWAPWDSWYQNIDIAIVVQPSNLIWKQVEWAINEYDMIQDGDKILVAVSGGTNSLCLLNILLAWWLKSRVKYEVAAVTVDPLTWDYDPSPLKRYMQSLGVEYFYE